MFALSTIFLFLIVLSLLVFVHELGHFWTAKKMGMKVEEFGFGFPPRIFGIKRGETTYTVNWIPLGGFVRIKGESGANKDDEDSFAAKAIWKRFVVLIAGVVMNLVLAAVLLSVGFMIGLPTIVDDSLPEAARVRDASVQVVSLLPESPAAEAGIQLGDKLVAIDGEEFETSEQARAYIAEQGADGVNISLLRNEETVNLMVTSEVLESTGEPGIGVGLVETGLVSYGPIRAVYHGVTATAGLTVEVVRAFGGLFKNLIVEQRVSVDLSGPVGIAVLTGEVAALGFVYLLQFAAVLSINLAVINVLPFPALDGGRILFLVIEKIRGKAADQKTEAIVHNIGFLMLMMLVVLVTYRDIVQFGDDILRGAKSIFGA